MEGAPRDQEQAASAAAQQAPNWSSYEVNHRNWNTLDCRVVNLEPQERARHRSEGRLGWSKKSMSHAEKVRGVAQILKKIAGTIAPPPRKRVFLSS